MKNYISKQPSGASYSALWGQQIRLATCSLTGFACMNAAQAASLDQSWPMMFKERFACTDTVQAAGLSMTGCGLFYVLGGVTCIGCLKRSRQRRTSSRFCGGEGTDGVAGQAVTCIGCLKRSGNAGEEGMDGVAGQAAGFAVGGHEWRCRTSSNMHWVPEEVEATQVRRAQMVLQDKQQVLRWEGKNGVAGQAMTCIGCLKRSRQCRTSGEECCKHHLRGEKGVLKGRESSAEAVSGQECCKQSWEIDKASCQCICCDEATPKTLAAIMETIAACHWGDHCSMPLGRPLQHAIRKTIAASKHAFWKTIAACHQEGLQSMPLRSPLQHTTRRINYIPASCRKGKHNPCARVTRLSCPASKAASAYLHRAHHVLVVLYELSLFTVHVSAGSRVFPESTLARGSHDVHVVLYAMHVDRMMCMLSCMQCLYVPLYAILFQARGPHGSQVVLYAIYFADHDTARRQRLCKNSNGNGHTGITPMQQLPPTQERINMYIISNIHDLKMYMNSNVYPLGPLSATLLFVPRQLKLNRHASFPGTA
eukprot:1157946-Pelagomonas_calceolata.AAC.2